MKVFVAGATGIAGWRAVRELVKAGHDVTALARTDAKAKLIDDLGGKPVKFDVFDRADVIAHAGGHEAVVNLLTHIPPTTRAALVGSWKENDRIRREASANFAAAAREGGGRMIQESLAFTYDDAGSEWLTEESPITSAPHTESMLVAEANALAVDAGVVLRFGFFYAPDSEQSRAMLRAAKLGFAMLPGDPGDYASSIWGDDIATAVVAALTVAPGVYNIVDDEPLTRAEGNAALAAAAGRKKLRTAVAKAAGKTKVTNLLQRSQRVSNAKFKEATGWKPQVPSQREGWPLVARDFS
jgi:nucleoside-diphosphate-sugar epimerase